MTQQLLLRIQDDELYWSLLDTCSLQFITYIRQDCVRVLWGLGMVEVNGRLLRFNMDRIREDCGAAEFEERISRGHTFALRKICPVAHEDRWDRDALGLGAQCGVYVLFFGSAWKDRSPTFSNKAFVSKWGPRVRTWDAWLVLLQRRARRWLAARRSLAFAMCLQARLGAGSAAAALGADLAWKICARLA